MNLPASSPCEIIAHQGIPLGYVLRADYAPERTEFMTPDDAPLQMGLVVYPRASQIPPHVHHPVERRLEGTTEVILVRRGRCIVDFYTQEREHVRAVDLETGDIVMLLASGGHGFRLKDDTILFEVKQGPYVGEKDKERFPGAFPNL